MKVNKSAVARKLLAENPSVTAKEVAKKLKITEQYAYALLWKLRQPTKAKKAKKIDLEIKERNATADALYKATFGRKPLRMKTVAMFTSDSPMRDNVNHPAHYKVGGIETIDFIEAKNLGYHLGNVVKYVTRADHKGNKLEDLKKAQWYLNRELENLSKK